MTPWRLHRLYVHTAAAQRARQLLSGQARALPQELHCLAGQPGRTRVRNMPCEGVQPQVVPGRPGRTRVRDMPCEGAAPPGMHSSPTCWPTTSSPAPAQCRKRDYGGQYSLAMRGLRAHKDSDMFRWWAVTALTLQALHGPEGLACCVCEPGNVACGLPAPDFSQSCAVSVRPLVMPRPHDPRHGRAG